ncbi:GNAT family N-acetyltransferase [Streptomyces sp. NPDC052225]|uniref:GNAT family N-acetyltransferase n=1 Tax=Streptomyces sp. NPDC052225 TaxID=3154949 RepID=UPI003413FB44
MALTQPWPAAPALESERLALEPLTVAHAREAFAFLDDARLHRWTGGAPPAFEDLELRFRRQAAGHSPDGSQGWLNWMVRRRSDGVLVGTVQATLDADGGAEIAWVVGYAFQGHGYGTEGARAMTHWLRDAGVRRLTAHVHPENIASAGIAGALGLTATDEVDDGEIRWARTVV